MSPSVVSGEGDGLLAAEQGLEKICSPLCFKGLAAVVASRGGWSRIDVGELETGVALRRATLTFNGGKHAILSLGHNNYNYVKCQVKKLTQEKGKAVFIIDQSSRLSSRLSSVHTCQAEQMTQNGFS